MTGIASDPGFRCIGWQWRLGICGGGSGCSRHGIICGLLHRGCLGLTGWCRGGSRAGISRGPGVTVVYPIICATAVAGLSRCWRRCNIRERIPRNRPRVAAGISYGWKKGKTLKNCSGYPRFIKMKFFYSNRNFFYLLFFPKD